ncbi:alcohol-forming fatty acyl-CoA reductase-like isoform X3 [Rhodamnia argentea]|uniref:Fatty acyl-CoA reductase n=1 Tax=Rhodamnia argentea TaxID=178133 RepID=A0A8B8QZB8_9MYRT|nr:alcohol-forming fatty acyl-CoA reductase-like isoform X3 [Rhodamnia argentea]
MGLDIVQFLENKTILVTGATGFLAKSTLSLSLVFVEKILRVQPNVKKMYVFVRATDKQTATRRLHEELIQKELFDVLRKEWPENFNSIVGRLDPIPGDVSCENLGVHDLDIRSEMWREVDIIVNSAATTKFDERYDIALAVNAFGAKHVAEFAARCANLKMLLHVSTAYVCGEMSGIIREKLFSMGETPNGSRELDVNEEKLLVEGLMDELREKRASQEEINIALKDLGLQRTLDSIAVRYSRGRLKYFLGNPNTILDTLPADMVVNAMIVAIAVHADRPNSNMVYQVGSSMKHPMTCSHFRDIGWSHFKDNPWITESGKPVKVRKLRFIGSKASFNKHLRRYTLLSKVLKIASSMFGGRFQSLRADLDKKVNATVRLAELYEPYVFFKGIFDDTNTDALRATTCDNGVNLESVFYFDPRCIDWEDYFKRIHLPGVVNTFKSK